MIYHKCYKTILGFIMSLCITACGFGNKPKLGNLEEAQDIFISNVQTMSERDALSNEIDYYRPPRIFVKRKIKELTGRDAIHECTDPPETSAPNAMTSIVSSELTSETPETAASPAFATISVSTIPIVTARIC